MNSATRLVAWVCTLSTLLMGCYTSVLVDPTDAENVRTNSGYIDYVVTKDEMKYEFEKPPVVANDKLVGEAAVRGYPQMNQEETSIPFSRVAKIGQSNSGKTEYVVTKAGEKYTYNEPPAFVNGTVLGKGKFAGVVPVNTEQVSIPLSDIRKVEASQLNIAATIGGVVLGCALVAGVTYAIVVSSIHVHI